MLRALITLALVCLLQPAFADERAQTQQQLDATRQDITELKKLLGKLQEEKSGVQKDLRGTETEMGKLEKQVQELQKELKKSESELERLDGEKNRVLGAKPFRKSAALGKKHRARSHEVARIRGVGNRNPGPRARSLLALVFPPHEFRRGTLTHDPCLNRRGDTPVG